MRFPTTTGASLLILMHVVLIAIVTIAMVVTLPVYTLQG